MTRGPLPGREPSQARRKLRNGKPFRRQGRSQPGRGQAEGQGRANRCSSPAPPSAFLMLSCAATRLAPARSAPASRFRAPGLAPRSCASTPTKARSAICGSPLATTPARPQGCCASGVNSPAGSPASTPAGSPPRRVCSTSLCRTQTASHPTSRIAQGRAIRSLPPPRPPPSPSPSSRTPQQPKPKSSPFGCSIWSSPSACAGRGPCR
jgi:hypothetical protein